MEPHISARLLAYRSPLSHDVVSVGFSAELDSKDKQAQLSAPIHHATANSALVNENGVCSETLGFFHNTRRNLHCVESTQPHRRNRAGVTAFTETKDCFVIAEPRHVNTDYEGVEGLGVRVAGAGFSYEGGGDELGRADPGNSPLTRTRTMSESSP
jgi:hypothetical protein